MAITLKSKRTVIKDPVNKKLYANLTDNNVIDDLYTLATASDQTTVDLSALQAEISSLQAADVYLQSQITLLSSEVIDLQAQIDALQIEITNLQNTKQDNLPPIAGNGLKYLRVKSDETGYEYATAGGGGGGMDVNMMMAYIAAY